MHFFPADYFKPILDVIWKNSANAKLQINCGEIAGDTKASKEEQKTALDNPIFVGNVTNGAWVFKSSKGSSITMQGKKSAPDHVMLSMSTTKEIFGADADGPFYGKTDTMKSVIGRDLSLLPDPPEKVKVIVNGTSVTTSALSKEYFENPTVRAKSWKTGSAFQDVLSANPDHWNPGTEVFIAIGPQN